MHNARSSKEIRLNKAEEINVSSRIFGKSTIDEFRGGGGARKRSWSISTHNCLFSITSGKPVLWSKARKYQYLRGMQGDCSSDFLVHKAALWITHSQERILVEHSLLVLLCPGTSQFPLDFVHKFPRGATRLYEFLYGVLLVSLWTQGTENDHLHPSAVYIRWGHHTIPNTWLFCCP